MDQTRNCSVAKLGHCSLQPRVLCFSMGSVRRSAPQVSDLIDTAGVSRARAYSNPKLKFELWVIARAVLTHQRGSRHRGTEPGSSRFFPARAKWQPAAMGKTDAAYFASF